MSGFSAEWLALREPFDARARNPAVLDAVVALLKGLPSVRIVDLACGTGSTLRALAPRLTASQNWRLADNDLSLLGRALAIKRPASVAVEGVPVDLNHDLEAVLDGPVDLIATTALLDLVSDVWLERLAVETVARSVPVYAALSYDGRIALAPADPLDVTVVAAVNAHQRTNKGFGPALGPTAAAAAVALFEKLGYSIMHAPSDWVIGAQDREFQIEIFSGWAGAARETGKVSLADAAAWLTRRRDWAGEGRSSIRVGHVDFLARPTGSR
jgi:SAM-dependent methyltransferase